MNKKIKKYQYLYLLQKIKNRWLNYYKNIERFNLENDYYYKQIEKRILHLHNWLEKINRKKRLLNEQR
ncbi:MAG: hypothetical protein VW894_03885 [Gammaproteobacteria bacterium]